MWSFLPKEEKSIMSTGLNQLAVQYHIKVPDNLSPFSRHDLAYFEARSSILLNMSHVSMKLRVLQRFCKNSDSFLSIAQN